MNHVDSRVVPGTVVGSWEVRRLLREEWLTVDFEVAHCRTRLRAVLEVLQSRYQGDGTRLQRFRRVGWVANAIAHSSVRRCLDAEYDESLGVHFRVTEHCDAPSLDEILQRDHVIKEFRHVVTIAREVLEMLRAADVQGFVLRDLSPRLFLFDPHQRVPLRMSGFDQVRVINSELTRPEQSSGVLPFMSPEYLSNARDVTHRSDLYSLGAILYQCVAGRVPFEAEKPIEIMHRIDSGAFAPLRSLRPDVPPALDRLITHLMERDPDRRPQHALEALEELELFMPSPVEVRAQDPLAAAGFSGVRPAGLTEEGLERLRASDDGGAVTLYRVRDTELHGPVLARADALRFVATHRPWGFVPIERELALPDGSLVWVRRDPVPPHLPAGAAHGPGPALAVAVVALRALGLLRLAGRAAENFSLAAVRADLGAPDRFACLLTPPVVFERRPEAPTTALTHAAEFRGNVHYLSPEAFGGRGDQHAIAYAVGALLHEMLAGTPPFADIETPFELNRKLQEDPSSIALQRPDLPRELCDAVDRLVARDASARSRALADIERDLLALLGRYEDWAAAAQRVLATAPPPYERTLEVGRMIVPAGPSLAQGRTILDWTVLEHLHSGGEAEVYRVERSAGLSFGQILSLDLKKLLTEPRAPRPRGVLKLWFEGSVDAHAPAWREFEQAMRRCGQHAGFPAVLDAGVWARGQGRPFLVLEEVDAPRWRALTEAKVARPAAAVLELGARLLELLAAAQEIFRVVGDVSASNVLVRTRDGAFEPVLLDVAAPGIDRAVKAGYGTPGYAAPEVADHKPPTAQSDLFSAGVLLTEFALGRRLYPETVLQLLVPVGGYEPALADALGAVRKQHGPEVHDRLRELLAIDPAGRPPSAREAGRRFERSLRRARVHEASLTRAGSSSLAGVERSLPRPVAQMSRAWRLTRSARDRVLLAFTLGECLARYLAAVALADYLSTPQRDKAVEALLAQRLREPGFGTWAEVARETTRAVARRRPLFAPALAEFFDGSRGEQGGYRSLEALIPSRNEVVHGRLVVPEGDVGALSKKTDALVRRVLDALRALCAAPLFVSVEEDTARDGSAQLSVLDLRGTAPEPDVIPLRVERRPPKGCVTLASPSLDARLLLDPFVVWRSCARCGGAHAFVIAGLTAKGEVQYLDAASGHHHVELAADARNRPTPFPALLEARETLLLGGELNADPDDAMRLLRDDRALRPGAVWQDHTVEEELGQGASGVVYRARHNVLQEPRALKVIRPEFLRSEGNGAIRRLQREAETMARLKGHPGVVRVLDFKRTDDDAGCAIVMELVEGGSLDDRLRRPPPPSLDEVFDAASQLMEALAWTHQQRVIHRDLKPSNVLVGADGRMKITDFGLALDAATTASRSLHVVGSAAWRAPEQFEGVAGPAADVFALGLILFDLTLGRAPASPAADRRALLRRLHGALRHGEAPPELDHHGRDPRLLSLLADLVLATELDPAQRRVDPAVHLRPRG